MTWFILSAIFIGSIAVYFHFQQLRRNRELLETVTQLHRGTTTERDLVLKLLRSGVSPKAIFHDLYVRMPNGNFCQIDLVVATKVGLIVFEIKKYSGWIFGTGYQRQWTQVLDYGKQKFRFYNPIMQNKKHILDLKTKLPLENIPYFSVIVFYGDCVLKDVSFVAENTYLVKSGRVLDVIDSITSNNQQAQYSNKREIIKVLEEAVENGRDLAIKAQHVDNIRNMLGRERVFD